MFFSLCYEYVKTPAPMIFNSGGVRQDLHPVDGSHDSSAVPPKPDFLWHAQPRGLRGRTPGRSLVVPATQRVSTGVEGTSRYPCDGAALKLRPPLLSLSVVTEDCYPYHPPQQTPAELGRCMMQSRSVGRGKRQATQRCPNTNNYQNDIYQSTPPYRLSTNVSSTPAPSQPRRVHVSCPQIPPACSYTWKTPVSMQHFNLSHVFVRLSLVNEHGHTRLRAHQHHEATMKIEGREAD